MRGRWAGAVAALSLVVIAAPARANVVRTRSASGTGTTTARFPLAAPSGNARELVVGVSTTDTATVSSVTFGTQSLTRADAYSTTGVRSEVWTLVAPAAATGFVTATVTGTAPVVAGAAAYSGVSQANPIIRTAGRTLANVTLNGAGAAVPVINPGDAAFGNLATDFGTNGFTGLAATTGDGTSPDLLWASTQGAIVGSGASRSGPQGFPSSSTDLGWGWRLQNDSIPLDYAVTLIALRSSDPVVSAPTATNIRSTSATLRASVDGAAGAITARGFVYCSGCGTPVSGDPGVTTVPVSGTTGSMTAAISGLTSGTTYTFRGYATNADSTGYSPAATFIANRAPVNLSAGGPYTVNEGSSLALGASATDPDGNTLTYAWDLDGNGTTDATGATPTVTPAQMALLADGPATGTVKVTVSDGEFSSSATATVTVDDVAPSATFDHLLPSVNENGQIAVGFSAVSDPSAPDTSAGLRYAYDWDNDGVYDLGGTTYASAVDSVSHTVPTDIVRDGPKQVTIHAAIIDKDGGIRDYRTTFTVNNVAPTATFAGVTAAEGSSPAVALTNASDPSPPDNVAGFRYAFDFNNDGTWDVGSLTYADASTSSSATVPASLLPDGPATRTLRAAIIDKDGAATQYTATLTVTNAAPTATVADVTVDEGAVATIAATGATDASAGDVQAGLRYAYDFDDDGTWDVGSTTYAGAVTTASRAVPAALTADDGSFHVRVAVIDRDGGVTVYRPLVTVTNVAPAATITGPDAVGSSGAVTVTVGATDPSPADVLTLTLDWGDGTVETVAAGDVSHTYRAAGTYTARLVARDDDGGESAPATHTLTVAAAPASPPPPPPPPTQTAASSPPLDAKALTFTLAGKGRQLLLSKQQIPVVVNCGGVACTITVAAEIRVKGKRLKLTPLKASLPTGNATPLKLTTTSAQRARIRKLVGRHGTKATLAYTITATDVAGAHVTRTGTIALRRLAAGG